MPPIRLRLILPKVLALFFVTHAKFLEFRTITIETIPPIINLQPMVVRFIRKLIIGSGMLEPALERFDHELVDVFIRAIKTMIAGERWQHFLKAILFYCW